MPPEEENIGQRTRSKLNLSERPLEEFEQSFIPPDITFDMYDFGDDDNENWNNFLKDFAYPMTQEEPTNDDPENDPEYNILDDEEFDFCKRKKNCLFIFKF